MRHAAMRDGDLLSGALLIGFGAPHRDDDALRDKREVGGVEPDQFRAPKPSGKADQEKGTVAAVFGRGVADPVKNREQIIAQQWRRRLRRSSSCSSDTAQRSPDEVCRDWVRELMRLVGAGDRGKAALQCGDGVRVRVSSQERRNHQRRRGQRSAPGLECSQIAIVRKMCIRRAAVTDKLRNPVQQICAINFTIGLRDIGPALWPGLMPIAARRRIRRICAINCTILAVRAEAWRAGLGVEVR